MDKKLIDRAHEIWAAAQLTPDEGIEDGAQRVAEVLSRIDAERGKEAVAYLRFWAGRMVSPDGGVECDEGLEVCREGDIGADGEKARPVFLSPTTPEGMALVPIEPTPAMCDVIGNRYGAYDTAEELYAALIAAAQGERNAD